MSSLITRPHPSTKDHEDDLTLGRVLTTFRHGGRVAYATVLVALDTENDESDETLLRLTSELEGDVRELGEVHYLPAPGTPQSKGVQEIVAGTIAVVLATDPAYIQALVETVVAFLRRNEGRRARLTVGDVELVLDQPNREEVADLIEMARSAIERKVAEQRDH
jgi:hypothetical protein